MRARNIKPAFFTNEILGTYDPIIVLLFSGLWCLADRDGRLEDRPLRIKAELFPYRENLDVNGYLTVLERDGFIVRYKIGGISYIQVLNFSKHQNPHHTEKSKNLPAPPLNNKDSPSECVLTPLSNGESQVPERSDSLIPDSLIPDSSPNTSSSAGEPFVMSLDWLPNMSNHDLESLCQLRGITAVDPLDPALLDEFRRYWAARGDPKTDAQWLNQWIKNLSRQQQFLAMDGAKLKIAIEKQGARKNVVGFVETHTDKSWADGL